MMDRQGIINALLGAIIELYEQHQDLFSRGVREEAITFHLAGYLYGNLNIGEMDIDLDVEYNKNQDDPKDLEIPDHVREDAEEQLPTFGLDRQELDDLTNDQGADIRPDIVVHERGTHESNIFVAEIKKESADIGTKDVVKVVCLTHPGTGYNYDYGAVVPLGRDFLQDDGLFWVENGGVRERLEIDFT